MPPSASRRLLLTGAGATTTAVAGTVLSATPAEAAYRPRRYRGGPPLLSAADRHLVTRFSGGLTPSLAASVRKAGGGRAWFEQQLLPARITDDRADALKAWWPDLSRDPQSLWSRQIQNVRGGWEVMFDYQRWVLQRRMLSRRQVSETLTAFWENHFNVTANGDAAFVHRTHYGEVIRANALGRFADLLFAAVTHPAMLIYLDNAVSTKAHPNENLGRELLELHTVGRGLYTDQDVIDSARILTGWRVDVRGTWQPSYRTADHWTGRVTVMDFTDANADPDGRALTRRYLDHLARHPATAQRVARRLATKFVRDNPPQTLVDRLAEVYLTHDTDIRAVLRALIASPEFAGAAGAKVRDAFEDQVATYRIIGPRVLQPTGVNSAANATLWAVQKMAGLPLAWPRPDGYPIHNEPWCSSSRVLASLDMHRELAGGWWPRLDIRYRAYGSWVPRYPMRFDVLVDALCRRILHRPSTPTLLKACCEAVDVTPGTRVTRRHRVARWDMPRVLATLLDSPEFFSR